MMSKIHSHLNDELRHRKTVILWGAGQLAMKVLALPCLAGASIRAIVDCNPILKGKTLHGAPIVAPSEIAGTSEPIVITTLLHATEIAAQILRLGLNNPVVSLLPAPPDAEVHGG